MCRYIYKWHAGHTYPSKASAEDKKPPLNPPRATSLPGSGRKWGRGGGSVSGDDTPRAHTGERSSTLVLDRRNTIPRSQH